MGILRFRRHANGMRMMGEVDVRFGEGRRREEPEEGVKKFTNPDFRKPRGLASLVVMRSFKVGSPDPGSPPGGCFRGSEVPGGGGKGWPPPS